MISQEKCKERKATSKSDRKNVSRTYRLRKADGQYHVVCQHFFLNTLGFKKNNDKIVRKAFERYDFSQQIVVSPSEPNNNDMRGKGTPTHKIDHSLILCSR